MRDAVGHWHVQGQCHAVGRSHHGRDRRAGDRPVVMGLIQDAGSVLLDAATCPAGLGRVGAMRRRAFGLRPVPSLPSRPFGFNPSRLRACGAARFACLLGIGARPIPPRCAWRPCKTAEPACAGSAKQAPRHNGPCAVATTGQPQAGFPSPSSNRPNCNPTPVRS